MFIVLLNSKTVLNKEVSKPFFAALVLVFKAIKIFLIPCNEKLKALVTLLLYQWNNTNK